MTTFKQFCEEYEWQKEKNHDPSRYAYNNTPSNWRPGMPIKGYSGGHKL